MAGRVIYLTGNDGTGKTTQADLLIQRLREAGRPCRYIWLRYPQLVSIPVLVLSRLLGVTRYERHQGKWQGQWEFYRARWLGHLLLWCQVLDAYWYRSRRIMPAVRRGETVVLDRFVYDIVIDIAVAMCEPAILRSRAAKLLYDLAIEGVSILIDAPPQLIRERRSVLAADALLDDRALLYRELAAMHKLPIVDARAPISDVHEQIGRLAGVLA